MATRSGGGTGVIVALVVFIITTVFLLVMTIVFYSNYNKAQESLQAAKGDLQKSVTREEQGREEYKRYTTSPGQSVFGGAIAHVNSLSDLLVGTAGTTADEARAQLKIDAPMSVRQYLGNLRGEVSTKAGEIASLNATIASKDEEIASLKAQMTEAEQAHARQLEGVHNVVKSSEEAASTGKDQVQEAIATLERAKDDLEEEFRKKERVLRDQIESLTQENTVFKTRVDQLQRVVEAIRMKPKNPAELVDGNVIDVASNDQVFIDIGERDRVVLGMTFEVYDDAAAIRPSDVTGEYPRGKASLQVIKVADTTTTCKITRAVPGRPVVRNDVIANAIYDPEYHFKFLVHGIFDIDGDGRSTASEAEFLRSQIVQWGGTVVEGESLVGDLDFLVLGLPPREPTPLPPNPTQADIDKYARAREVFEDYNTLFQQATQAQIPVLNWARLQVLIGYVNR